MVIAHDWEVQIGVALRADDLVRPSIRSCVAGRAVGVGWTVCRSSSPSARGHAPPLFAGY